MSINEVKSAIYPFKQQLSDHPLYSNLKTIKDIQIFMSMHIYCVWDFMNLLTYLQRELTCVTIPWKPVDNPHNARLINEIVLEEESDIINKNITSHFSYYLKTLNAVYPECSQIQLFVNDLKQNMQYQDLINQPYIPEPSKRFLNHTFNCIESSLLDVVAAFSFGRECLIPDMFESITKQPYWEHLPEFDDFIVYLKRHIELDGDSHGPLAEKMVENVCVNEADWHHVTKTAIETCKSRICLWDSINTMLTQ